MDVEEIIIVMKLLSKENERESIKQGLLFQELCNK